MKIIGISALTHDSGMGYINNGKIDVAVNEERFSRKKMHSGFPFLCKEYLNNFIKDNEIDYIAASDLPLKSFLQRSKGLMFNKYLFSKNPYLSSKSFLMMLRWELITSKIVKYQDSILKKLYETSFKDKLVRIEHHPAHAASAFFASGFKKALIVTADNHGDFLTVTVSIGENNQIKQIKTIEWPHSPGFFYSAITKVLGFKPGRHEGKITGLAAYGNVNSPAYDKIKKLMWYENGEIYTRSLIGSRGYISSLVKKYGREDLSAVFQRILEDVMSSFVGYYIDKTGIKDVALAGGIFANVRLNQKVKELGVNNIFIFPHMGDGGTSVGAAFYQAMLEGDIKPYRLHDVYFGPSYSDNEIKEELIKNKLEFSESKDIEGEIAELINKKKVIARFNGAMEFGPRALGNRSILYQATDPTVNDWLNKQLKRTEFMPFAPVTLSEDAAKCYKNLKGAEYAAEFMTITFNCTDYMKKNMPAVVHVDGTARPQLINKEINPSYYTILHKYKRITGLPSIVNTSFNMHEEPIVCSPDDAIRSFKQGHLDYLAIGNYLVKNK